MLWSRYPLTFPLRGPLPLPTGERGNPFDRFAIEPFGANREERLAGLPVRGAAVAHRAALLAILLALAACGFHPLYAPRAPRDWDADLAAIAVSPIPNRAGQILELALRENLNPGGTSMAARWRLNTTLLVGRSDLGIQRNATATSSEITVTASYSVIDVKNSTTLYSSSSRAVGDFNQLNDAYATQVAADDAQDRALHEIADEMAMRMALFVRQQRAKAAAP